MAEQAAKFTAIAQRDFDVKLDYSAESIASFEEVLDKMYRETHGLRGLIKRNRMTDQRAQAICLLPGAYLGETLRRLHAGHWDFRLSPEVGAEVPTLDLPCDVTVFPQWKVF